MKKILITLFAVFAITVSVAEAADDGRFDLHGRPAPAAGVRRERPKGEWAKGTQSYPTSIGGDKSYEYISSFVVDVTEDGYYKVTVKVVCPQLYNSDGTYPAYSGEAEFMNVWIDWNADFNWDSSERVLAKEVTDYDDVLANNRIIYYRATVKPQTTASGIVKARAMLGWGYNPSDPTTYSWRWGDVKDVSVNLGCVPPRIYSVAFGQHSDPTPLVKAKKGKVKAANFGITKNNSVLVGSSAPFHPYIVIRKVDRESGHFSYSARLESDAFEKPIVFSIAQTAYGYYKENGEVYGYYSSDAEISVPMKQTIRPADYGQKKGTLIVDYWSAGMEKAQIREDFDFYVFYPYDQDVRFTSSKQVVPLWFAMWGRIVPGLNKFSYDQSILAKKEAGECSSAIIPPPYISGTVGDPFTVIGWSFDLKISSAALKIENEFDIGFNGGTFTQSKVDYAIDSVARTVQHELKHKEAYEAVTSARFIGFKSDGKLKFCSALDEEVECKDANGNWIDGDWLIAQYEATYDTSVNLRDTYLISNKSGWRSYARHGDQEYWVRRQVNEVRATEKQRDADWSNLGRNWQKALGNINAGCKPSRSASESASTILSDEQYQKVLEEKKCLFTGAPDVSFESAAVETTSDYATRGLSFRHGVSFADAGTYAFTAYLTDVQGKPLAYATVGGEYPSGASTVEFVFDANTMAQAQSASSSRQYRLDLVACQSVESDVSGRSYSAQGLCTTADYSGQVCESSEWFVMGSPTDEKTDDGLMVTVPLWIPEEGDYSLKLVIGLENELTTVSDVLVSGHYARGAHNVGFLVPNDAMYASKHNGKFKASSLRVATDGGLEGELLFQDLEYDTEEYDYADFRPVGQQVTIDPSTIELNLVDGKEGTAGYSGVQARFSVRTTSPSSSRSYRFSARLSDISGKVVATASEALLMLNAADTYALYFSGVDIRASKSPGPYVLTYIGIYDEEGDVMMDEYKAAAAKSEECSPEDFAGGIEVDEEGISLAEEKKDGLITKLRLTIPVTPPAGGHLTASAVLRSADGTSVAHVEKEVARDSAEAFSLALEFNGTDVFVSRKDGPYSVVNITLTHSDIPDHPYVVSKAIQTASKSWKDFDNGDLPAWNQVVVHFHSNDGRDATNDVVMTLDEPFEAKSDMFKYANHVFAGWYDAAVNGHELTSNDKVTESLTDVYAHWIATGPQLSTQIESSVYDASVARSYSGWMLAAEGQLIGTFTASVGKLAKGKSQVAVTVTVVMPTGKKMKLSEKVEVDGKGPLKFSGELAGLVIGAEGLTFDGSLVGSRLAELGAVALCGGRNLVKSKDKNEKALFDAFKGRAYTFAFENADKTTPWTGSAGFSVVFSAKGKAKVAGTLPDGTKVSQSVQLVGSTTSEHCCLPILFSKRGKSGFSLTFWLNRKTLKPEKDSICGTSGWTYKGTDVIGWKASDVCALDPQAVAAPVVTEFYLDADKKTKVDVTAEGKKWKVTNPKNEYKAKISYTMKTGSFKGAYKTLDATTGKSVSATVNGVVVDKVGYGSAVIKKTGSMPVTVK